MDAGLPVRAFRFCLDSNGLDITDIDCIAFYEDPAKKWDRQSWSGIPDSRNSPFSNPGPMQVERIFRERLGYEGPVLFFDHHLSHAASAFYYSGFEEAAIITVDGVGEWATTSYGLGRGKSIKILAEGYFQAGKTSGDWLVSRRYGIWPQSFGCAEYFGQPNEPYGP